MKQSITALSMCEAEYIAATAAVQQTAWLRRTLLDIRMLSPQPTPFFMDNQCAIRVVRNTGPTKRRKFIDLRHHFLSHHANNGNIVLKHVPSADMLAGIFTKLLRSEPLRKLTEKLQITTAPPVPAQQDHKATGGVS